MTISFKWSIFFTILGSIILGWFLTLMIWQPYDSGYNAKYWHSKYDTAENYRQADYKAIYCVRDSVYYNYFDGTQYYLKSRIDSCTAGL